MSEQHVSPDGRWRWDGSQWVPNSAAPPPPPPYVGYPPNPYPYPPGFATPRSTNGMAIASMVLGILWLYWVGSVLALIFGYTALKQIRERNESGHGMAVAGIVLGWIGVGVFALFIVLVAVGSTSSTY